MGARSSSRAPLPGGKYFDTRARPAYLRATTGRGAICRPFIGAPNNIHQATRAACHQWASFDFKLLQQQQSQQAPVCVHTFLNAQKGERKSSRARIEAEADGRGWLHLAIRGHAGHEGHSLERISCP